MEAPTGISIKARADSWLPDRQVSEIAWPAPRWLLVSPVWPRPCRIRSAKALRLDILRDMSQFFGACTVEGAHSAPVSRRGRRRQARWRPGRPVRGISASARYVFWRPRQEVAGRDGGGDLQMDVLPVVA